MIGAQPAAFALDVEFVADSEAHQAVAGEYREIWREDGARILQALSEATGVRLREKRIRVIVHEGISRSGLAGRPMYLRASYPASTKRATLVHELAHRYLVQLDSEWEYSDIHFPLSLLLYQVWSELWGEDFARAQASVESGRAQRYEHAWDWVLSMSDHARAKEWSNYIAGSAPQPAESKPAP